MTDRTPEQIKGEILSDVEAYADLAVAAQKATAAAAYASLQADYDAYRAAQSVV